MQAVLTVAGNSSRMFPFGGQSHKATLRLLGKALIVHTIEALIQNGVDDIVIVDSQNNGVKEAVSSANLPIKVTFVAHEGARGMGEALLDAKKFLQKEFLLIHAHHIDAVDILPGFLAHLTKDVAILVKKTSDVSAYGGVTIEGGRVISLEEKPADSQKYGFRIVGFYFLNEAFVHALEKVEKAHYSFEEALSIFAKEDTVKAIETEKEVISLKYPWHILDLNDYLLSRLEKSISPKAVVAVNANLEGKVFIDEGARIESGVVIKGPAYVGKNTYVGTNAIVRGGVTLESGVVVGANMEVKHSILMRGTTTHSGYIGDSVIGEECKVAAFFCTGNVRIDRESVKVNVKEQKVDSQKKALGVFMGNRTKVGIRVSTMPGVLIGPDVVVGPSTTVFKNVPAGVRYYAKITEVIEEQGSKEAKSESDKKVVLFDIDYTLFDTKAFKDSNLKNFSVYKEVVDVLGEIGAYATLGIFSEGDEAFQKAKLLETAIETHFHRDNIHVVSKKSDSISDVLDLYKDTTLFLVDDRLEVLFLSKKYKESLFTIWMKRGPFALMQKPIEGFSPDATIEDLRMVLPIVAGIQE